MIFSKLLSSVPGIEHGFGTRHSPLSQDSMASLKQIHSDIVMLADRESGCIGEADALIASEPGIAVSIRTADCLPVLLADRRTGVVAAAHAGWRGTAARIVEKTIERMQREYGTKPEDLVAAVGPGIGECCYEVGAEVARQFGRATAGKIDLAEYNRRQLVNSGVGEIDVFSLCTYCEAEQFFSYRREGDRAGRMISFIRRVR